MDGTKYYSEVRFEFFLELISLFSFLHERKSQNDRCSI